MRRRAALVASATVGVMALGASSASAHESPENCRTNALELSITKSRALVRNGDTIDYTVNIANSSGTPCDVTDATVKLTLPAADGSATGREVTLEADGDYPASMAPQRFASVSYTVALNPGVTNALVQATADGTLHDNDPDDEVHIAKTLGTRATQPHATLTKTATPDHGTAPLTVTYDYRLTNDSTTNVPIRGATVTDDKCAPVTYTGGDSDADGLIDVGESWSFVCTQTFNAADTIINTATATGTSSVDDRPVPIPPAHATVTVVAPPVVTPPVVTPPAVTPPPPPTTPVANPPSTPPASAVLGKTYTLSPINSKAASKNAPCVSVPKRLSVRAGELTVVRVRIRKEEGHSLSGALVRITGPGFVKKLTTDAKGEATFKLRSTRTGTLVIQSDRCLGADRVGVLSARNTKSRRIPRVTG